MWGYSYRYPIVQAGSDNMTDLPCPLCSDRKTKSHVSGADKRQYYHCSNCGLIFADPAHSLSAKKEKEAYETHNNSPENRGYVQFLNRAVAPMMYYLNASMTGLDYGCGPGPTVSWILKQNGIQCENYDPFFLNIKLKSTYDFIFCTECFEHFFYPEKDIVKIRDLLKPCGLLCVMTNLWTTFDAFRSWQYTRDNTHVSFYSEETFRFICRQFGFDLLWQDHDRVLILRKR